MNYPDQIEQLRTQILDWKSKGKRIVFTNGVFDILHAGHVDYLQKAKALGDILVVGINNDASVKRLNKGADRPINPEIARVLVINALRCVDATILFGDDTPLNLIQSIMPDILVKGGDYDPLETDPSNKKFIVGSTEIKENGGSVIAIPLVDGFSSTSIINKIRYQS